MHSVQQQKRSVEKTTVQSGNTDTVGYHSVHPFPPLRSETNTSQLVTATDAADALPLRSPALRFNHIAAAPVIQQQENTAAPLFGQAQTVQRYRATQNGLLSDGELMEVRNTGALYATNEKVAEANQKSKLVFTNAGGAGRSLVNVAMPPPAAGAQAAQAEAAFDWDEWRQDSLAAVIERVDNYLDGEIEIIINDNEKLRKIPIKQGAAESEDDFKARLIAACAGWRAEAIARAIVRINAYADNPNHTNAARLLMPSDCGMMATAVSRSAIDLNANNDVSHTVREGDGVTTIAEWSHHVAATIMTDGTDYVTMENEAAKVSDFFSKPEKDRNWNYRMYGAGGQSFNATHNPLMSGGQNIETLPDR